jgi:hypothetical protein
MLHRSPPYAEGSAAAVSTSLTRFRSAKGVPVSKKTKKRKLRARRNKANHGKRPNVGRR